MKTFDQFCRDLVSVHYIKDIRLNELGKEYVVNRTETDLLNPDTSHKRLSEIAALLLFWLASYNSHSQDDAFFNDKISGARTFSSMLLQHPNRNIL